MYPKIYNSNYDNLKKFKSNLKLIKIFFSGSTNSEVYGKFTWYTDEKVKLLNRVEIIEFIIKNFEDKIFFLKSYKDLNKIDYLKICDDLTLEELESSRKNARLFAAVWLGKTRLTDNMLI